MPKKGSSKVSDRNCLICEELTRMAHFGMDICRACSIFYRRAKRSNNFSCRANTNKCVTGRGLNCKRCRYYHIVRILARSDEHPQIKLTKSSTNPSSDESPPPGVNISDKPLLERLRVQYKAMSTLRLHSELHARPIPPHPLQMSLELGPFYPATFGSLTGGVRIFLSSALTFGSNMFPEFASLPEKEKWQMVVNFFFRFRIFENGRRANKLFPGDQEKNFMSYTTLVPAQMSADFFADSPLSNNIPIALEYVRQGDLRRRMLPLRDCVVRVNPCHEEFLAITCLMFWANDEAPISDEITTIGRRYREATLKELHAFYREDMGLDDYAARLGE
ncbi:hypothetical protein PFISCL1PPCAC_13136, partial [Pristionchus fissidentatus]